MRTYDIATEATVGRAYKLGFLLDGSYDGAEPLAEAICGGYSVRGGAMVWDRVNEWAMLVNRVERVYGNVYVVLDYHDGRIVLPTHLLNTLLGELGVWDVVMVRNKPEFATPDDFTIRPCRDWWQIRDALESIVDRINGELRDVENSESMVGILLQPTSASICRQATTMETESQV